MSGTYALVGRCVRSSSHRLRIRTPAWGLECRGQDITGATSCWTPSSRAALESFPINLIDLPNAVIGGIKHRMRDNAVSHYRVVLDPAGNSRSWLSLQVAGTTFGPRTTQSVEDLEGQKKVVTRSAGPSEFRGMTRIRNHGRTGWLGEYKPESARGWCYAAVLAFEPSPWAAGSPDEMFEMVVRVKDCTGRRTREQLEEWLYSLREVADGYNRK